MLSCQAYFPYFVLELYVVEAIRLNLDMSLRISRAATRIRPSALRLPLQRRGYADPVSDKIKLTLALPHQVGAPQPSNCSSLRFFICHLQLTFHRSDSQYTSLRMCALPSTFTLQKSHEPKLGLIEGPYSGCKSTYLRSPERWVS